MLCAANRLHRPQGSGKNGQIIEFTDSRPMCYHLRLTVVADSVPCSATKNTSKQVQRRPETQVIARVLAFFTSTEFQAGPLQSDSR